MGSYGRIAGTWAAVVSDSESRQERRNEWRAILVRLELVGERAASQRRVDGSSDLTERPLLHGQLTLRSALT